MDAPYVWSVEFESAMARRLPHSALWDGWIGDEENGGPASAEEGSSGRGYTVECGDRAVTRML